MACSHYVLGVQMLIWSVSVGVKGGLQERPRECTDPVCVPRRGHQGHTQPRGCSQQPLHLYAVVPRPWWCSASASGPASSGKCQAHSPQMVPIKQIILTETSWRDTSIFVCSTVNVMLPNTETFSVRNGKFWCIKPFLNDSQSFNEGLCSPSAEWSCVIPYILFGGVRVAPPPRA